MVPKLLILTTLLRPEVAEFSDLSLFKSSIYKICYKTYNYLRRQWDNNSLGKNNSHYNNNNNNNNNKNNNTEKICEPRRYIKGQYPVILPLAM